jgi:UPF0755 protein
MTDQGHGYGAAPWGSPEPNQGNPHPEYAGYPQSAAWGDPQAPQPYPQQQPQQPQRPQYQQQPQYQQPQHPQQPQYQQRPPQPQQPYGNPQDPYGTGQYPTHPGYGQQQAPVQPRPAPAQAPAPALGPDGIDWEAEAAALEAQGSGSDYAPVEEEAHRPADDQPDLPAGYEDEEEAYQPFLAAEDESRSGERRRKQAGRTDRKRSGVACLGISMLLAAMLAGGGYYGYGFYEKHWGPPADYAGSGSGSVTVAIPKGALGWDIANVLKADGVVESAQAFVDAYTKNPKASTIQPGSYTLQSHMSAASALAMLLDANGGNVLIVSEGMTAAKVYALVDTKLGLPAGTTAAAAKKDVASLGLPAFAHGNIEGFLAPARYSVAKGVKPDDLLKQMVSNAVSQFQSLGMDAGAPAVKLQNGYQVLIEASILQAEGNNVPDFGKIARVLNNRINEPNAETQGRLGLDTTLQYALGSTKFTTNQLLHDPAGGYNTYIVKGLPPGPISNPGKDAINAVLNPTPGNWLYFIAMDPTHTAFAASADEFRPLVRQYCTAHKQGFDSASMSCK